MKKQYPSWDLFKAKYPSEQLQRDRFEDLARVLFCDRYGIKYGIFQFVNHAGNETDTINDGADIVGFNAKFFESKIDESQIIHSIEKAHEWHPNQTKMLIYTNIGFGNPTKGESQTKAQKNIEDTASKIGMVVEWVNDKMILDHAAKIDWVNECFFEIESPIERLVKAEESNTKSIFAPIRTSSESGTTKICVDYSQEKKLVMSAVQRSEHVVIYGEGGCGKTALLKNIWETNDISVPICVRKAQDIKNLRIDTLFTGGFDVFIDSYKDEKIKVMVIDSAERIQGIEDRTTLESFITILKDNGWSIIFTVRDGYLESLLEDLQIVYNINPTLVKIEPLSKEKLKEIAKSNSFLLPLNETFQDRLGTLFYLDLYLKLYSNIDIKEDTYSKFAERIWKGKIAGKINTEGKNIKRERLFISFIKKLIENECFYLSDELFDPEIVQLLIDDEILARNDYGLFITHDIYEEFGLSVIISKKWQERSSVENFFETLNTSILVRKVFRQWLSDNIESNIEDIKELLSKCFNSEIEQLWKDEMLIGIMESSSAKSLLENEKSTLIADDAKLLNRIVFLLQLACKRLEKVEVLDDGTEYPVYVPFGSGWGAVIHILYELREQNIPIKYKLKVLKEWTSNNHQGLATREAGIMALTLWVATENTDTIFLNQNIIKDLCAIITNASNEIKSELSSLIKKVVDNKWNSNRDPYYDLCHYILSKPIEAKLLICAVPNDIFPLMNLFWRYKKESSDANLLPIATNNYACNHFWGLNDDELEDYSYEPAYSYSTPLYYLLHVSYWKTLEYIVDVMNSIIDYVLNYGMLNDELKKITISLRNQTTVEQYGNSSLWSLYRGSISVTCPDVIISMHMALERVLLEFADTDKNDKVVMDSFDYILSKSKSVSLTAIVSSIVSAHPVKYVEFAINLFKTIDLFPWDSMRLREEYQLEQHYGLIQLRSNLAGKERLNTLKQSFRKRCLESLCAEYQYVNYGEMNLEKHSKLIKEIHSILDSHYETVNTNNDEQTKIIQILLYRMDKRKHDAKISKIGNRQIQIEMNPQLPADLRKYSEDSCNAIMEQMRFGKLLFWCECKFKGEDVYAYKQYEDNPLNAIQDVKDIIAAIHNHQPLMPMDNFIPANVAGTMLLFYGNILDDMNIQFCKQIVENVVSASLNPQYLGQISDGLELCVHALPILMQMYPDNNLKYVNMMAGLLCNQQDVGVKRICDYAIETLVTLKKEDLYNTVVAHYITIATKSKQSPDVLISLDESLICMLDNLDLESAEVLFELIPNDSENELHKAIIFMLLPRFAETLERNDYHNKSALTLYDRRLHLYNVLASYALNMKSDYIESFLAPFIDCIDCNENCVDFIRAFVRAEDNLTKPVEFWKIWQILYSPIIEKGIGKNYDVLVVYLLADSLSAPETKLWHSFDSNNFWLYNDIIRDCGYYPSTLYAIAKNLNYFASTFVDMGVEWLYKITTKYPTLNMRDKERSTIIYMEMFMGRFIRKNRSEIRKNKIKKSMLVAILTFMVERNSVQAFMLRDLIA